MKIKQLSLLRGCLLLLIVSGAMVAPHEIKADAITISGASITGNPDIPCDGSSVFHLSVSGMGPPNTMFDFQYQVIGASPVSGISILIREFVDQVIDGDGRWSASVYFTIRCVGCELLEGPTPPAFPLSPPAFVFVSVDSSAIPGPGAVTNQITVDCVTPEPTTMLLLGTGLAGVAIKTRKKLKSRRSG